MGGKSYVTAHGGGTACHATRRTDEKEVQSEADRTLNENVKNLEKTCSAKNEFEVCEKRLTDKTPDIVINTDTTTNIVGDGDVDSNNKTKSNYDDDIYAHYEPKVRLLRIRKTVTGACGFHLTRSKWDPYPWVSAVDAHTAAGMSGLQAGDCVLEVNGEDVLGLRIADVAKLVKAKSGHVTLLLWSSGCNFKCNPESLCCAPMPRSLQRLSVIVQSILAIIECPVCLDTIPPPAMQCQNGHLLCVNCRIRAEKCPVCRDRYMPQRALIAEQIYAAITNAYNLCRNEDKLREKLFGHMALRRNGRIVPSTIDAPGRKQKRTKKIDDQNQHVALATAARFGRYSIHAEETNGLKECVATKTTATPTPPMRKSKFLMKLWLGKAYSMGNLSTISTETAATKVTKVERGGAANDSNTLAVTTAGAMNPPRIRDGVAPSEKKTAPATNMDTEHKKNNNNTSVTRTRTPVTTASTTMDTLQLFSNRSGHVDCTAGDQCTIVRRPVSEEIIKNSKNHLTSAHNNAARNANAASEECKKQATPQPTMPVATAPTNNVAHVAALATHFLPVTNDLLPTQQNEQQPLQQAQKSPKQPPTQPPATALQSRSRAIESCASSKCPSSAFNSNSSSYGNSNKNLSYDNCKSSSLLMLDKRRPCHKRRSATECIPQQFDFSSGADDNVHQAEEDTVTTVEGNLESTNSNCSNRDSVQSTTPTSSPSPALSCLSSGVCRTSINSRDLNADPTSQRSADINNPILSLSPNLAPSTTTTHTAGNSNYSTATALLSSTANVQQTISTPVVGSAATGDGVAAKMLTGSTTLENATLCICSSSSSCSSFASCSLKDNENRARYRCPCDCGIRFNASTKLQQHIKLDHRLPIVSFGHYGGRLVLPLQPPVDNAVLILEAAHNANDDAFEISENDGMKGVSEARIDDKYNADNKSNAASRQAHNECPQEQNTKECWIRVRAKDDCILAAALLQATAAEGADYVLEMRLSGKDAVVELQLKALDELQRGTEAQRRNEGAHSSNCSCSCNNNYTATRAMQVQMA